MAGNETPHAAPPATPANPAAPQAPTTPGAVTPGASATVATTAAPGSVAAPPAGTPAEPTKVETAKEEALAKAQQAASKAKNALEGFKKLGFWTHVSGIAKDLTSTDQATRKMARYFFLSLIGVAAVLVSAVVYIHQEHVRIALESGAEQKALSESAAKQAEEAREKYASQSLGIFSIELKPPAGTDKKASNVMNLAEVEIVVQCDEKETCSFIEDNMPQVRNQLTDIFVAMERDEILSKDGKRRLKGRVLQKLNAWLPKGKIENLFFDKLVVN
jgi:flagellar basal body-associated protein FliL